MDSLILTLSVVSDGYLVFLQGDITQILGNNGNDMVKYTYDAWGNHTIVDTSEKNLGNLNPFRYRSYYYDTETGLYYLMNKYYDPETGRFISQNIELPSIIVLKNYYVNNNYSFPWKISADWFGEISHPSHDKNLLLWSILYADLKSHLFMLVLIIPTPISVLF